MFFTFEVEVDKQKPKLIIIQLNNKICSVLFWAEMGAGSKHHCPAKWHNGSNITRLCTKSTNTLIWVVILIIIYQFEWRNRSLKGSSERFLQVGIYPRPTDLHHSFQGKGQRQNLEGN